MQSNNGISVTIDEIEVNAIFIFYIIIVICGKKYNIILFGIILINYDINNNKNNYY